MTRAAPAAYSRSEVRAKVLTGLPVLLAGLALAAPAEGRTCTVGPGEPGCETLAAALAAAEDNGEADVVRLPAGTVPGGAGARYASPERLEVVGAGAGTSEILGPLRLDGARVVLREATVRVGADGVLSASGFVRAVRVTGTGSDDAAGIRALPGAPLVLDDVLLDVTGVGAALEAECATLTVRHATVLGRSRAGARAACAGSGTGRLSLDSSVVGPEHGVSVREAAGGEASVAYSNLAGAATGAAVSQPVEGDPEFVSDTDARPAAGSILVERGNPAPLAIDRPAAGEVDASEPGTDLGGDVRAADGDRDGRARRDVGAFERQPGPSPVAPGNVLENPDAESVGAAPGAIPGWEVTAGFETIGYGTDVFPSARHAQAIGGDQRLFGGGARGEATATQVVDVASRSAGIDTGGGRATLSGLLGGYRGDGDEPEVRATFRGPSGVTLGMLELDRVDAAARANATSLLARSASGPIPALTRSIEVTLRATKAPGGTYADAYFDNLGLALDVPGGGGGGDGGGGDAGGGDERRLKPFAGVVVLTGSATLVRATGRSKLLVGCASATVARCTGDLVLEAVLRRRTARVPIGRARVSLAPGQAKRLSVKVSAAARSYLRTHTALRVRVRTTAVDGQGVRRASTVPIVMRPQRRAATR